MSLSRGFDAFDPLRPERIGALGGSQEIRPRERGWVMATGTLACPECDAPVAPAGPVSPPDALGCPFCGHAARVRDFLSLEQPTRPARVEVRVFSPPPARSAW